jgi:4-hydroxyphenylpyruvate dioxygenase
MESKMAPHLSLTGYHSIQFYVKDLERAVRWHREKFDFREVARSTKDSEKRHGMRSIVLRGPGQIGWIFTQPIEEASTAGKYLKSHPEGLGFLNFEVKSIAQACEFLAERKAPFLYDIQEHRVDGGLWRETAIATPLSDAGFRFIEKSNYTCFAPGFEWTADWNTVGGNKYQFEDIDHVTCNMRAMIGLTEFYRHCLGFERYWGIDFHTAHHNPDGGTGSGLESIVMWDPQSGIKFATNQPLAPYFNNSQIQIYVEDNGGGGIQHIALSTPEIIPVVRDLRKDGCRFLEAPGKYYEQLPKRMDDNKIGTILEPMDQIRKQGILVDGRDHKYLLQLFMKEMCEQFGDAKGGPFFYEIIQRAGDPGFGDGNFKALFDSIEQGQVALSRQEMRDRIDCLF